MVITLFLKRKNKRGLHGKKNRKLMVREMTFHFMLNYSIISVK